jgi:hypothetical protein
MKFSNLIYVFIIGIFGQTALAIEPLDRGSALPPPHPMPPPVPPLPPKPPPPPMPPVS